jgi:hypothetical protein
VTAKQFNVACERLGIESHRRAALVLGIGRSTVIRYAHGRTPAPESIKRLLTMLQRHGIPEEFLQ